MNQLNTIQSFLEEGVRELAQTDAVEKVSRLMVSETDILAMYACWFVSNMCASSTFQPLSIKFQSPSAHSGQSLRLLWVTASHSVQKLTCLYIKRFLTFEII